MSAALDDLDRKILSELQTDAEQSLDEIARKVGSSKTPVWNRIKRMREACAVAATVLSRLREQVRPGITTHDLDQIGRDLIASFGARSACHGWCSGPLPLRFGG